MTIRMKEKIPEKEFIVVKISFNKTRFLVKLCLNHIFLCLKKCYYAMNVPPKLIHLRCKEQLPLMESSLKKCMITIKIPSLGK